MDSRPREYGKTVCSVGEKRLDGCNALSQNTARQVSKVGSGRSSDLIGVKPRSAMSAKS